MSRGPFTSPWGEVEIAPAISGEGAAPASPVSETEDLRRRAWAAAAAVVDPELPVLTIADLGVLRDVTVRDGQVEVAITPTYSGCPAMNVIALEIGLALDRAGIGGAQVRTVLSPAWTTAWLTPEGRRKLAAYGVAPPQNGAGRRALFGAETVLCPQCGSVHTERLSEFGSTSCKALWRCTDCREPFDYFKCH
ncbi:MAG: phenylacetate-CoA oxygenase subunit PaaJ [Inquilinus limosus]|uniref:Phenylacetate-CoA oxygenase subunit PaaJ n=1 Tax=Inquilinus limosus TaxID=171674 RepID=A0A952FSU9_9PROT|nr:phenylacetate-CoA oxygenase subunit PaaJ [Inquilinus limosus]